jgi:N-6 DNA Methylase
LACSGLAPNAKKDDWLKLAGKNERLRSGMEGLYGLFKDAPVLGSLINPRAHEGDLLVAAFHELQPLLEKAMAQETEDDVYQLAVTARGVAKAAEILSDQFTLVATNVPYLGRLKQHEVLKEYSGRVHPNAKADLATVFVERCLAFCATGGTSALVTLQNWLFLGRYEKLRDRMLRTRTWNMVAQLGEEAWWTFGMRGPRTALLVLTESKPNACDHFCGVDVSTRRGEPPMLLDEKAARLAGDIPVRLQSVSQAAQLKNPDSTIAFEEASEVALLSEYAESVQGASTLDIERFRLSFWEVPPSEDWTFHQSTPTPGKLYSGAEWVSIHRRPGGEFEALAAELKEEGRLGGAWSGQPVWGKLGVACSWMGTLPTSIYLGVVYDNSIAAIIPKNPNHLAAIWCYCSSRTYVEEVRRINQKPQVANATLIKVPFDLAHWQKIATEKYPYGLPRPYSTDPTQWLFNGQATGSDQPLLVAVARLLGYMWPRQTGSSFLDCPALGPDGLEKVADDDGIVCINPIKGEQPAAERLRALLVAAFGAEWTPGKQNELLEQVEFGGKTLEDWLRNGFFEQHCQLFHQRPFIWHIWDGRRDGFSALVNYHMLNRSNLEKLTYTFLGDWIARQKAANDAGEEGSDARLQAAIELKLKLEKIIEGEPPYDIFVRWKPLEKQPIGWEPDLNDGVRLNIRPFVEAGVLRKDPNINWKKDRGKDVASAPWYNKYDPKRVPVYKPGDRINDYHLTLEEKRKARNKA